MRWVLIPLVLLAGVPCGWSQWNRTVEQLPEYRSLPDRTEELQSALDASGGRLELRAKYYRITRSLVVDLARHGAARILTDHGATLIMDGPGPALILKGTHQGTAAPGSFDPVTWNQRMPIVEGFEILGAHPQADGIELRGTVGAIIQQVGVRWCRDGIRLADRNRNVIVGNCHLYENSRVGLYLDHVNLHQINVVGCHISYNRQGGVVVRDGNVRNLQISGCDIESNMPDDESPTNAANVWIDLTESTADPNTSVAEISITGCTLQHSANYSGDPSKTVAPGGANIRLAGKAIYPIDSVTISGNVISDTTHNIDIAHAQDVTIGSNTFFAPKPNNLVVRDSRRVIVHGNTFNPREFVRPGTIRFENCLDSVLASSTIHRFATELGAIVLEGCNGFTLSGLNLSECGSGIVLRNCNEVLISGCLVRGTEGGKDLVIEATCRDIVLGENAFRGETAIAPSAVAVPSQD